ncbi:MAG: hypothetical protein LBJ87_09725 [bacterium]|jgi:hypothetical protein|nr:hypothetical protein [bacterium]
MIGPPAAELLLLDPHPLTSAPAPIAVAARHAYDRRAGRHLPLINLI